MIRIEKPLFSFKTNLFPLNIHKKKICYFFVLQKTGKSLPVENPLCLYTEIAKQYVLPTDAQRIK